MDSIVHHVPEQDPVTDHDSLVCHTARFETSWPKPATAIVAGHGELDAANGIEFVNYALRNSDKTRYLVADLSGLTFFSTAGFSALHTLNVQCVSGDIRWALVPSNAVNRLLRICDPDSALPICADVAAALTAVQADPPRSLKLVAEPR
ncbi:STAS domain-containing protein [Mycolicibacterium vaccae]|uniref:Anti-sigma-factor antagonist n=1 Tax=Mycolicibacterium vaccae ATCC 25954 TaxID=1194972 RepID=K0V8T3_MYCVA|nr:anti-sigma factor antagonist [Mycolicibacterium vaccae 95051]EJZ11308.1 anti-sigma-factor antagonist [Mycolicibacterium vaccae ATCC 25954]MCV7061563.1 STAS domain-containing protein [Mycolicibacterium vaccae]